MAPRRSARPIANPKPSKPALGKTKVTKPTTKKLTSKKTTTQTPTVKEKKRTGLLWWYLLGQQAAHHSGTHLYNHLATSAYYTWRREGPSNVFE
jgi:hypothetical protein